MYHFSIFFLFTVSNVQQKELEQIQKDIDSLKATNAYKMKQKEEKNERLKENEDLFKQKSEGILLSKNANTLSLISYFKSKSRYSEINL